MRRCSSSRIAAARFFGHVTQRLSRELSAGKFTNPWVREQARLFLQGAWIPGSLPLSGKWSLPGADPWHLAPAKILEKELPELVLLTFDVQLREAGRGEGLA